MDKTRSISKTIIREVYLIIPVLFYLFLSVMHHRVIFINFFFASVLISALCIAKRKDIMAIMDDKIERFKKSTRRYAAAHITTSLFIIFATLLNTIVTTIASVYYTYAVAANAGMIFFLLLLLFDAALLLYSVYGLVLILAHMNSAFIFLREMKKRK
jgi:hypothetical protein